VERLIVAVAGMPGSGKSTVAKILSEALGCPLVSMGDVVREEVRRRGLPLEPHIIEDVAKDLRKKLGPNAVAIIVSDRILKTFEKGKSCVVVDGLRSLEEAKTFSKMAKTCILAVHASPFVRLERLLSRGRAGDVRDESEFIMRDKANLQLGLGEVIALADFMIVNEGGLSELEREVKRLAGDIRGGRWRDCGRGRG